jgi:hypothetical protein
MPDVYIRGFNFLTGSQNVILMAQVTKSLAGWATILRLLPDPKEKSRDHPESHSPGNGRIKDGKDFTRCNIAHGYKRQSLFYR